MHDGSKGRELFLPSKNSSAIFSALPSSFSLAWIPSGWRQDEKYARFESKLGTIFFFSADVFEFYFARGRMEPRERNDPKSRLAIPHFFGQIWQMLSTLLILADVC